MRAVGLIGRKSGIAPVLIQAPGATLAGIAHLAKGAPTSTVAALIVAGAPQTRVGAHGGFAHLAGALAEAGVPCLRFDRRGLGDSDGDDPGFHTIAPDIAAALAALRHTFPSVRRVIGIGLCDGAAALLLAPAAFDALILLNPWTRDETTATTMPPRAALAARYRSRFRSPAAWRDLLRGRVNFAKIARGLRHLLKRDELSSIARVTASNLARYPGRARIILAERDNTAQAFAALWQTPLFARARAHNRAELRWIAGATHTFAGGAASKALADAAVEFARAV